MTLLILFIIYIFGTIGMTLIVVKSQIFQYIRDKYNAIYILHCIQCMGFWSGLVCGIPLLYIMGLPLLISVILWFIMGCTGSLVSLTYDLILEYMFVKKEWYLNAINIQNNKKG